MFARFTIASLALAVSLAACGSDTTAASPTTAAPTVSSTVSTTAPTAVIASSITPSIAPSIAPSSAPSMAPATTSTTILGSGTGQLDVLLGQWFFACEPYIPRDGATSAYLEYTLLADGTIDVWIHGLRYTDPDCQTEPISDAESRFTFAITGQSIDATSAIFQFSSSTGEASVASIDAVSGELDLDGSIWTRTTSNNTPVD